MGIFFYFLFSCLHLIIDVTGCEWFERCARKRCFDKQGWYWSVVCK